MCAKEILISELQEALFKDAVEDKKRVLGIVQNVLPQLTSQETTIGQLILGADSLRFLNPNFCHPSDYMTFRGSRNKDLSEFEVRLYGEQDEKEIKLGLECMIKNSKLNSDIYFLYHGKELTFGRRGEGGWNDALCVNVLGELPFGVCQNLGEIGITPTAGLGEYKYKFKFDDDGQLESNCLLEVPVSPGGISLVRAELKKDGMVVLDIKKEGKDDETFVMPTEINTVNTEYLQELVA